MTNFPYDVWNLHRKLHHRYDDLIHIMYNPNPTPSHHRYLRFRECFQEAEQALDEYQSALNESTEAKSPNSDGEPKSGTCVFSLMSDSATEEENETEEENGVEESATGPEDDAQERDTGDEDNEEGGEGGEETATGATGDDDGEESEEEGNMFEDTSDDEKS